MQLNSKMKWIKLGLFMRLTDIPDTTRKYMYYSASRLIVPRLIVQLA